MVLLKSTHLNTRIPPNAAYGIISTFAVLLIPAGYVAVTYTYPPTGTVGGVKNANWPRFWPCGIVTDPDGYVLPPPTTLNVTTAPPGGAVPFRNTYPAAV